MKLRIRRSLRAVLIVLTIGALYALFYHLTGWGIPCVFHVVTGLQCPGCGVTRMCMALLRLDLPAAWESNCALLCMLPLLVLCFGDVLYHYIKHGTARSSRWANVLMVGMLAVLLIFGVWRNLPL